MNFKEFLNEAKKEWVSYIDSQIEFEDYMGSSVITVKIEKSNGGYLIKYSYGDGKWYDQETFKSYKDIPAYIEKINKKRSVKVPVPSEKLLKNIK